MVTGVLYRLVILGKQAHDVLVRLDNIMYHPLMKFINSPETCAPYCFPTNKVGAKGVAVSGMCYILISHVRVHTCAAIGCVKYCTPTQYERKKDTSLVPSRCR